MTIKTHNWYDSTQSIEAAIKQSNFLYLFALFIIGFVNAIPIPLTGTILSVWFTDAGIPKSVIGDFALLAIPFSLKLLWTPIIDHVPFPILAHAPRKSWIVFATLGMALSVFGLSLSNPSESRIFVGACILCLHLFTGCLYMVGIAYELESIDSKQYGIGSAYLTTGYRIGLLLAGAGSLYLSSLYGWSSMFQAMAAILVLSTLVFLAQPEPYRSQEIIAEKIRDAKRYPSILKKFWNETLYMPTASFLKMTEWKVILIILLTFKCGDDMAKSMEGPFYLSLGYTKADLAVIPKVWGVMTTMIGAFLGGVYFKKRINAEFLLKIGVLHSATLFFYYSLSGMEKSLPALVTVVALQNLTSGLAMTTFIAYLWKRCDPRYAAIQYALYWSVSSIKGDFFCYLAGHLADHTSWGAFYFVVACTGLATAIVPLYLVTKNRAAFPLARIDP